MAFLAARRDHAASAELRAVRALILDDDVARLVDSVEGDATGEQPVTVSPPGVPTHPRRRVNRSRERLQHELKSLRQQAIALEDQIATITRGSRRAERRGNPVLQQAWRTVALDQQDQERQGEHEREQLRDAIKHTTRCLKRVRRIVRERILRNQQFLAVTASRLTGVFAMDVTAGYREITRQLGLMRVQANAVFQGPRQAIESAPATPLCYDRDTFELPFDVRIAAEAAWLSRLNRVARVAIGMEEERALGAKNAVRSMFSAMLDFPLYTGEIHGVEETRRFVDGDRHYILQCLLLSRATKPDGSAATGFEFCDCNWTVVYPVATSDAQARPLSRMETFDFTVIARGARPLSKDAVREAQAFCRGTAAVVQQVERQLLENAMLDLARRVAARRNS